MWRGPLLKLLSLGFLVPWPSLALSGSEASIPEAIMSLAFILNEEGYQTLYGGTWRPRRKLIRKIAFEFKANPGSIPSEFKSNLGFIGIPNTSPKGTQQELGHQRLGDHHSKATLSPGAESRLA